jgi:symplekin
VDLSDFQGFELPTAHELQPGELVALAEKMVNRVWEGSEDMRLNHPQSALDTKSLDIWMLLTVRMFTRVAAPPLESGEHDISHADNTEQKIQDLYEKQDGLRQTLCDYIMGSFPARSRLATVWMNEEWYNDQIRITEDRNWVRVTSLIYLKSLILL